MPKTKKDAEGGLGDWSSTGTFLRKPTSGWLHEERELTEGCYITYSVQYLGCVEVNQSMRTLQYNVRTQVTKEAIVRMAERAGRLQQSTKKRKVPKLINKVLGASDTRWAGDVNLAVCVDNLRICNAAGREVMNHSLPSISFASGGDGPTVDFIGYVAKDPVHDRACHVFECHSTSQYVLTTIGQAFELRYKIYLHAPKPHPIQVGESFDGNDRWGSHHVYEEGGGGDWSNTPLPTTPPDPLVNSGGIYSDLPEFPRPPSQSSRPPSQSSRPVSGSPQLVDGRSHVYSNLPGFPVQAEIEPCYANGPPHPRLENPYDTMGTSRPQMQFSEDGTYSNPGEITASEEEGVYDNRMLTIRQTSSRDSSALIELAQNHTPTHHVYGNVGTGLENGATGGTGDELYDNEAVEEARGRARVVENKYDDPHALTKAKHLRSTPAGVYDNPGEIMFEQEKGLYDNPAGVTGGEGREMEGRGMNLYDNQAAVTRGVQKQAGVAQPQSRREGSMLAPRFDDTIYMVRSDKNTAGKVAKTPLESMAPLSHSLVSPHSALPLQQYFHGAVSRVEAEALLEEDGQFLVRESKNRTGQYVLTGMANGQPQHLLLVDKAGKVKSRDHEFESIPHLIHYFQERRLPLVIGNSTVYLYKPVINAFPTAR